MAIKLFIFKSTLSIRTQPQGIHNRLPHQRSSPADLPRDAPGAIRILRSQYPPSGNYPGGSFQSAHTVTPAFFSHGALDDRRKRLMLHDTPFLFNLVVGALARPANDQLANNELSAEPANPAAEVSSDGLTPEESEELEVEGDVYSTVMLGQGM
ncbi:hypothetical protein PSHT_06087 [Puccinia striiformis]|uniref:Uncharacterized protein n=1 Tax=Puccinia striiformis TaxID=27350 RepID=A0A2S4W941_9BASI|nr:hypothetical protein PSHT_06087 [Puccinia striiformis]